MLRRRTHRVLRLAGLLLAVSCESGTDPEAQHPIDLVLDFCANDVPVWFAYRNQGADWTRVTPSAEGTVSFTATNDVAIAFVRQSGADYETEIVLAANWELEAISGRTCREESGSRTVNGTIAGVAGSQLAQVTMSFSSVYLTAQQTTFSLTNLAARPLDVIASRANVVGSTQTADRLIIRRSQSLVNNATMPVLDFSNTAETILPVSFGITINGLDAGEQAFMTTNFFSQLETSHLLSFVEPVANGEHTAVGVPAQDLAAGDYHDAFVVAVDQSGAVRGAERYFLAPTNQTLTVGAVMGMPAVTTVATSPVQRLRAQLTRGADYARAMHATYLQESQFSSTRVSVTITGGYEALPAWDVTIPDLSGVAGWQNAWGLAAGAVEWTVTAFGGRPELLFGAPPVDGEAVRFASRSSAPTVAAAAGATLSRAGVRLPRPFSPAR
jgi:hypothetical protein